MIESIRDAAVAPADVFRLYADPSTWSEWGHNAKWARADGPFVEGGTVDVKAGYGKVYPCRIRSLVDGRSLVLEARPPFMTVIQTYDVEPTAAGAHIRHALEISGPLAGITQLVRLDRVYQGWLDKEVGKLIKMASRLSGGQTAVTRDADGDNDGAQKGGSIHHVEAIPVGHGRLGRHRPAASLLGWPPQESNS